ncbi:MAG: ScpA family protein [Limnochordia bacterium]|nr:ScpA family protein [Limnochordia bacterium]
MAYQVKLPIFQGPLDLLLTLVEEQKLPITEIALGQVADQYLDYVAAMPELDLTYCTQFLSYAVTLFQIKAAALLPSPPVIDTQDLVDEEEEKQILLERLLEYRKFKVLAMRLREVAIRVAGTFARPKATIPKSGPEPVTGLDLSCLVESFKEAQRSQAERNQVLQPLRGKIDLGRRIIEVYRRVRKVGSTSFSSLAGPKRDPWEKLGLFLALLELTDRGRIQLDQAEPFGEIQIELASQRGERS